MSQHDCTTHEVEHARGLLLEHIKTTKSSLMHHLETGNRDHDAGLQLHKNLADLQKAADVLGYGGLVKQVRLPA